MLSLLKYLGVVLLVSLMLSACATTKSPKQDSVNNDASNQNANKHKDDYKNSDPLESVNRAIFAFNDAVDRYALKPAAQVYRFISPNFVEVGVSNFFSNLREVPGLIHSSLQGNFSKAFNHSKRLLVNSTLGLLGFIDVAKEMGVEHNDSEDFGQTLASWGVGSGPYLVLPFFGPSTLRDGLSIPVNSYTNPISYVEHDQTRWSLLLGDIIDTRAKLLDIESLSEDGDKYLFIREAYLQRRQYLINNGKINDTFGSDLDDGDF